MSDSDEEVSTSDELPYGWTKHVDENGSPYYRNKQSGQEQGKRPAEWQATPIPPTIDKEYEATPKTPKIDKEYEPVEIETKRTSTHISHESRKDDEDEESMNASCMEKMKQLAVLLLVYSCIWLCVSGFVALSLYLLIHGSLEVDTGVEYAKNGTEEMCEILTKSSVFCQYNCDCDGIDDECSTCEGK